MAFGSGKYRYEVVEGWGQGPKGHELGLVSGVAVDSRDRVYIFNRKPQVAVLVFDRDGSFLSSWGEDIFTEAHSLWIGPDDRVYATDTLDHTVRMLTTDGKLLQMLGTRNQPSDSGYDGKSHLSVKRGAPPFNRPTKAVVAPSGAIYVSDGYGNARVHKFSPDGHLLTSWGEPGQGPGQFNLPHSVAVDRQERVYVVDRENDRIQVFDREGRFLAVWTDFIRPQDILIDADGAVFVAEGRGRRISILSTEGELLARWGESGDAPGQFAAAPHSLWIDSHGDLYVGEVVTHKRFQKFARV